MLTILFFIAFLPLAILLGFVFIAVCIKRLFG